MNKFEEQASFFILESSATQRDLAQRMGCSLGTVNKTVKSLVSKGLVDSEGTATPKLRNLVTKSKPKNAIILAAGFGMRSVPLNITTPKPLIEINHESLIERLIKQLHAAGVEDISIVVGFMKERFEYLIDQYHVRLIFNDQYKQSNNIWSMFLMADYIQHTYIVPGDIWLRDNPFSQNDFYSWYMVSEEKDQYSPFEIGRKNDFVPTPRHQLGNKMIGVAFVTGRLSARLRSTLKVDASDPAKSSYFWESSLFGNHDSLGELAPRLIAAGSGFDINTYEDLRLIDQHSSQLNSDVLNIIADSLSIRPEQISKIEPLKKGMTNRSFSFLTGGKKYIMRIPGEGTGRLIDRENEVNVYKAIRKLPYIENVIYINPKNGYKISEFINGARNCDPKISVEVVKCLAILRHLHSQQIHPGVRFELFDEIDFYESLWGGQPSVFQDYEEVKANILSLRRYVRENKNSDVLCHIDANYDNFIFSEADGRESLSLIDWEYAGEQDPLVDVAMFAIYAGYSRKENDWLLENYLNRKATNRERALFYSYISICGLLWSNWCQYKQNLGVEFGDYFMEQYRFAKEYSKYALKLIQSSEA